MKFLRNILPKPGQIAFDLWTNNEVGRKLGLVKDGEKAALQGKLRTGSAAVLAIGLVAELLGIDLAPDQVDALVTGVAVLGVIYGQWRASRNYE